VKIFFINDTLFLRECKENWNYYCEREL